MKIKIENVKIAKEKNFDIKKSGWQLQLTAKVYDQYIDNLYFDFGLYCLQDIEKDIDDNLFLLNYKQNASKYLNEILAVIDNYVSQEIGFKVEFENKDEIIETLLNSEFAFLFHEYKKYNELAEKLLAHLDKEGFYEKKH